MYMKPGTVLKYIHRDSDHPPIIIRAIPKGVNSRLSRLSSSEAIFNNAATPYQEALRKSGYSHKLVYNSPRPDDEVGVPHRRCCKRCIPRW